MRNENNEKLDKTVISSLSAASKTPFQTVFKITMGILFAQTIGFLLGLITLVILVILSLYIIGKL